MHVFAQLELAELQTVRRSVWLTVVGTVWLSELLPHGFSKRSRLKTEPGPHSHTPTHMRNGLIDEVTDKTDLL